MTEIKPKRGKLGTTAAQDVIDRATEYGKSPGYAGLSNFVENALSYYMGAIEQTELQALKEENEALKKQLDECKKIKEEYDLQTADIFKLITKYPKLAVEFNKVKQERYDLSEYTRKVDFT